MREKILNYLSKAGEPLPAAQILQEVLNIRSANEIAAARILKGIIADDTRFLCIDGLWMAGEPSSNVAPAGADRTAAFCLEMGARPGHARGALLLDDENDVWEFEIGTISPTASLRMLREAAAKLDNRLLIAWNTRDLQFLSRLFRIHRLDAPQNPSLNLRNLAARILERHARGLRPENLAIALHLSSPDSGVPKQLVRFLASCFPLLLDRIPAENRTGPEALQAWIDEGTPKVDFTRFGFGPELLDNIPLSPGVYVMRNRADDAIYVGKSRNLRRRVRSYFTSSALKSGKVAGIHGQLYTLEIVVTQSEVEALLLETRLIHTLRPAINLQTEIHQKRGPHARERNLLLLVPRAGGESAQIYFLRAGCFVARQSAPLGRRPSGRIKRKIRSIYFTRRRIRKHKAPWETELVSRWLAANQKRFNYVDIDEAGSPKAVDRRLGGYLMDPSRLREKVYYR